jgi:hypothetical protein
VYDADTLLNADDHFLLAKSKGDLQYLIYSLDNVATEFFIYVISKKTKIMAVKGTGPIRSKMCINYRLIEQMNALNYLGFNTSHEGEKD